MDKLPIKLQIPEEFFKEEIKCDFTITSKIKKIWAIELDLLNEFQQVCKRYNLTWFMAYGSLIGTVRHHGFIPWDNDIDVLMPRADYDKFCEITPKEFQPPYFLQTPLTEQGKFYRPYAKLCNLETTGASEQEWKQGINAGLFIDIFVLDEIPNDMRMVLSANKKISNIGHMSRFLSPYKNHRKGLMLLKHCVWWCIWKAIYREMLGDSMFKKVNDICRKLNQIEGDRLANITVGWKPKEAWNKNLFKDVIMMPFETLLVPIPIGYDSILRQQYGDYMQLPPIANRINHEYLELEPTIPYTEYFKDVKR